MNGLEADRQVWSAASMVLIIIMQIYADVIKCGD